MRLDCGSCIVRDWADTDHASLIRFANNRKVWRNLRDRFPHPYGPAEADWWLNFAREHPEEAGWAIEVDGQAVGGIGLLPGEDVYLRTAHIGYWLGEPYWDHGIMTDALRGVTDHALNELGFVRLEAPVYEWNPASMRVLEKCGYAREAVLRKSVFKDGQLINSILYVKVKD